MPRYKDGLSPKEKAFIEHYLAHKNAEEAAKFAGYSPRSQRNATAEILRRPHILSAIDDRVQKQVEEVKTDAKWVRDRLKEEATDYSDASTQSARVKAIELIGRLNGDFELDNKQKAGIFDQVPTDVLERIREKLSGIGQSGVAGKPSGGSSGGFTH